MAGANRRKEKRTKKNQKLAVRINTKRAKEIPPYNSRKPMRQYKDRVFRMIFKEKKEFLELYNAMNGTDYNDPEKMVVTTLENAIYIGMKNDVSYLLYDQLPLYEHQSTKNPNLPLRNLLYVANIFSDLTKDENLYGTKIVQIPEPIFVVFYNGMEEMPERSELALSSAYIRKTAEPALELKTLVININPGYNKELMERCRTLKEYMIFVSKTREYCKTLPLEEAMGKAVDECIEEDVLREFLRKNRAEVLRVSIFEYDEEKHIRLERRDAMEEGLQKGMEQGIEQGIEQGVYVGLIKQIRKKMEKNKLPSDIADALEEDIVLIENFCSVIREHPQADDKAVYDIWSKRKHRAAEE